jgi:hypothetical protein
MSPMASKADQMRAFQRGAELIGFEVYIAPRERKDESQFTASHPYTHPRIPKPKGWSFDENSNDACRTVCVYAEHPGQR